MEFWVLEGHLLAQLAGLSRSGLLRNDFVTESQEPPKYSCFCGGMIRLWWAERGRGPVNSEEGLSGGRGAAQGAG